MGLERVYERWGSHSEVSPIVMHATDTETGVDCYFIVQTHSMPEHVLD